MSAFRRPGDKLKADMEVWADRIGTDKEFLESLDVFLPAVSWKMDLKMFCYVEGLVVYGCLWAMHWGLKYFSCLKMA